MIKYSRQKILEMYRTENNYLVVSEGENAITYGGITLFTKTKNNMVTVDRQL